MRNSLIQLFFRDALYIHYNCLSGSENSDVFSAGPSRAVVEYLKIQLYCTGCAGGFEKAFNKILSPCRPLRTTLGLLGTSYYLEHSHFLRVATFCVLNVATVATFCVLNIATVATSNLFLNISSLN